MHPSVLSPGAGTVCRAVCHLVTDGFPRVELIWMFGDRLVSSTTAGRAFFSFSTGFVSSHAAPANHDPSVPRRQARQDPRLTRTLGQKRRNGGLRHLGPQVVAVAESLVWPKISHRHGEQARGSRFVGAGTICHEPQPPPCHGAMAGRVDRWVMHRSSR